MSDGEEGNIVNLHLIQNGQDGEAGGQSGSKDQNERKNKTPGEGFSDHEENSSSELSREKIKIKVEEEVIQGAKEQQEGNLLIKLLIDILIKLIINFII